MITNIKHGDETNGTSRMHLQWQDWHVAANGKDCAGKDCHRIWTWCLCVFVPSRYWQKGNAQYASVWKHALLSHFVVYFCGYECLENKPISNSHQKLGNLLSFKQWPLFQFCVAIFSHSIEFVSPILPACAVCVDLQHWQCGKQEKSRNVCSLSQGTVGSCIRCEMSWAPLWQATNATPGALEVHAGSSLRWPLQRGNAAPQTHSTPVRYSEKIF